MCGEVEVVKGLQLEVEGLKQQLAAGAAAGAEQGGELACSGEEVARLKAELAGAKQELAVALGTSRRGPAVRWQLLRRAKAGPALRSCTRRDGPPPSRCYLQGQEALQRMEAWEYGLPPEALERGTTNLGNLTRLQRVLAQALAGEPVHLVTVGGSITRAFYGCVMAAPRSHAVLRQAPPGHAAPTASALACRYVTQYFEFLNSTLPAPSGGRRHTSTNAAVSGTNSVPYEACADLFMPSNGSIYVLEMVANDGYFDTPCRLNASGAECGG